MTVSTPAQPLHLHRHPLHLARLAVSMDQLSRRDAVYQQLDQISSAFRPPAPAWQESSNQRRTAAAAHDRDGSAVSPTSPTAPIPVALGSPPMSPSRSLSGGGPLEYLNRVGSSLAGALQNSPLNGAPDDVSPRLNPGRISSLYTSLGPLVPPQAQQSMSRNRQSSPHSESGDLLPHQIDSVHGIQSAANSTESLPDYSRGSLPASQSVKYVHAISSPSSKIELTLESVGSKEYPVYLQDVCPVVAGRVRMRIQGDENAHELRIRVKGRPTVRVLRGKAIIY